MTKSDLKQIASGLTSAERKQVLDICELAYTGSNPAQAALSGIFGIKLETAADIYRISGAVLGAMSPTEQQTDYDKTRQALETTPPTMVKEENVLNKFVKLRMLKGLTQKQLAEISGLSVGQIQRYEYGTLKSKNMTLENAVVLAKALGVEPEELL